MPEESMMAVFEEIIDNSQNALVSEAMDAGRVPIGYTCSFVPEVLLSVDGLFPLRLRVPGIGGTLLDFVMNDKCAAGTGKFFEAMCRVFETEFDEFSELSLRAKEAVPITSQCSVFAESEVLSLISKKVAPDAIALGIQESVAQRCYAMLRRVGLKEKIAITGGCAKNKGLVDALTKIMKLEVVHFDEDPQLMGALGAAILARNSH